MYMKFSNNCISCITLSSVCDIYIILFTKFVLDFALLDNCVPFIILTHITLKAEYATFFLNTITVK